MDKFSLCFSFFWIDAFHSSISKILIYSLTQKSFFFDFNFLSEKCVQKTEKLSFGKCGCSSDSCSIRFNVFSEKGFQKFVLFWLWIIFFELYFQRFWLTKKTIINFIFLNLCKCSNAFSIWSCIFSLSLTQLFELWCFNSKIFSIIK